MEEPKANRNTDDDLAPLISQLNHWAKKGRKSRHPTYRAVASPQYRPRAIHQSLAASPSPPSSSSAAQPQSPRPAGPEARVPELAYTQTFQTSPNSKSRIEVLHHFGKVQIKSSDLDLSDFEIKPKGKGWLLSFSLHSNTPGGTPTGSPHMTPTHRNRTLGAQPHGPAESPSTPKPQRDLPG